MIRPRPTLLTTLVSALGLGVGIGITLHPQPSEAGAAEAEIDCTARTTGETLVGTIPRDGYAVNLTFDDGKGHTHQWSDEMGTTTLFEGDEDSFIVLYAAGTPELKLWAWPKTMKIKVKRHEAHGRFTATAVVTGFADDKAPRRMTLDCKYDYSI